MANEKIIHVKAISKYLSVNALIPERFAEETLKDILDNFLNQKWRFDDTGKEKLTVQTCVHNPTFF